METVGLVAYGFLFVGRAGGTLARTLGRFAGFAARKAVFRPYGEDSAKCGGLKAVKQPYLPCAA
ncbi:hypothetical protein HQN90_37220 [Paenibacillus alba]|nr:hypothetical protein [Paenibacillus alba]